MLDLSPHKIMLIRVSRSNEKNIRVKTQIALPENLSGIDNVDITGIKDGYVLMYDDTRQRYAFVDPDEVLVKAVTMDDKLPEVFVDKLDQDLDDRINLDAGEF
jgi:hypothetical protein